MPRLDRVYNPSERGQDYVVCNFSYKDYMLEFEKVERWNRRTEHSRFWKRE